MMRTADPMYQRQVSPVLFILSYYSVTVHSVIGEYTNIPAVSSFSDSQYTQVRESALILIT